MACDWNYLNKYLFRQPQQAHYENLVTIGSAALQDMFEIVLRQFLVKGYKMTCPTFLQDIYFFRPKSLYLSMKNYDLAFSHILSYGKISQREPMVIVLIILVELKHQMLHSKCHGHQSVGPREEYFKSFYHIKA